MAAEVPWSTRTWKDDGTAVKLLLIVKRPRLSQSLAALLPDLLLASGVQIVDLDGEFATHVVQQGFCGGFAGRRAGSQQSFMRTLPDVFGGADILQGFVADLEQSALLQVRRSDPPPAPQVAVQTIAKQVAEGPLRILFGLEPFVGIGGIECLRQFQRLEHLLR